MFFSIFFLFLTGWEFELIPYTFYNERQKIRKTKKVNTRSLSLNEVSGILFLGEKSVEVFHCLESEVPINA